MATYTEAQADVSTYVAVHVTTPEGAARESKQNVSLFKTYNKFLPDMTETERLITLTCPSDLLLIIVSGLNALALMLA